MSRNIFLLHIILIIHLLQAKGLGFMNQAQKDSHIDNNEKFAYWGDSRIGKGKRGGWGEWGRGGGDY